jgi:DNA helicase II / ATP-dependent DNA helicase PcrA
MTTPDHTQASGPGESAGPHLVFFSVDGRRDLAKRAAATAPQVRFKARDDWARDPGPPHRTLLRGGPPPVGLWLWRGAEADLKAQATTVLLQFVHPLVARGLPYCLGFPFGAATFAPRRLDAADAAALDLEDIGRLLGVATPASEAPRPARPGRRPAASSGHGSAATASGRMAPAPRPDAGQPPLDAAQTAAVDHDRGPARVLAPAGAGKTKTLVARVVRLIERGADPSAILLLAFNRKAAEQLEERLAARGVATTRRLGTPGDQTPPAGVHCATFNAFGYRYQREVLGTRIALDQGAGLRSLMRRAMETAGVSLAELKPPRGSDPVGAFMAALTQVRAALEAPEQVSVDLQSTGEQPLLTFPFAPVHAQFTRGQQVTGRQSFDDQIYFAVADMLAEPAHRDFIERRFDHLLVDEFQDLNGAQLALVDVLSRPGRGLFVVGDDDQLIYGWRRADPRGILEFHRRMPPKPWSATYTLGTNYRCSRAVVESSARLVANNTVREAKDVRPRAGAPEGALCFAGAPSWPERAAAACAFLREQKSRLACDWRDLAVLCRYRSQQFAVALALDGEGIPRSPTLGCRLFTHPAARLLRAYLELVRDPDAVSGADMAFLLERPNRYLMRAAVEAAGAAPRPWALVRAGAADEPAAGPRPLSELIERIESLRAELGAGPPLTSDELVGAIITDFELVEYWRLRAEAARRPEEAAAAAGMRASPAAEPDGGGPFQVVAALSLLAQIHPDRDACLAAWDALLRDEEAHAGVADDTLAREEAEEDRVVIGTIHAAKGREYDAVVIPEYDCDTSRWSLAETEEERRVVYVGVTRARDSALFTVDTSAGFVHPFLRELVETPEPDEHDSLSAWLQQEADPDLRARVAGRLQELEVLFPELVPAAATAAAGGASCGAWTLEPLVSGR